MLINQAMSSMPSQSYQPVQGVTPTGRALPAAEQQEANGPQKWAQENGAVFTRAEGSAELSVDYTSELLKERRRQLAGGASSFSDEATAQVPGAEEPPTTGVPADTQEKPKVDEDDEGKADEKDDLTVAKDGEKKSNGQDLSDGEKDQVRELRSRDQEVRTHEQAHVAAAGGHARGGINLSYQQGPDGQQYAVGGHVNIDTSSEATPEETIAKMQTVRRAALSPSQPSSADMSVAQSASATEMRARQQQMAEQREAAESVGGAGTQQLRTEPDGTEATEERDPLAPGQSAAPLPAGIKAYQKAANLIVPKADVHSHRHVSMSA